MSSDGIHTISTFKYKLLQIQIKYKLEFFPVFIKSFTYGFIINLDSFWGIEEQISLFV